MNKTIHCFVSGRVQGVCFRMSTEQQAKILGLTGWFVVPGQADVGVKFVGGAIAGHAKIVFHPASPVAERSVAAVTGTSVNL